MKWNIPKIMMIKEVTKKIIRYGIIFFVVIVVSILFDVGLGISFKYLTNLQLQIDLKTITNKEKTINNILSREIQKLPGVARLKINLIHLNPIDGQPESDAIYGVAAPGHPLGIFYQDRPVVVFWNDILPQLLSNQCVFRYIDKTVDTNTGTSISNSAVVNTAIAYLVCPLFKNGDMIGGLFASWDDQKDIPIDIQNFMNAVHLIAIEVEDKL